MWMTTISPFGSCHNDSGGFAGAIFLGSTQLADPSPRSPLCGQLTHR
jgi:hypothetical protein